MLLKHDFLASARVISLFYIAIIALLVVFGICAALNGNESIGFELAEKITRGDTAAAMKHLDDLFYTNTDHMSIFYNITSAFVDMYRALASKQAGRPFDKTAEDFKMGKAGFRLSKAASHLSRFDEKKLALSFDALLTCETELKGNSADKRVPLETLIVKLVYIMKTGEAL